MASKLLAALSPLYSASTGEGMFGDVMGVKSRNAAVEAANVAAEEDKQKREAYAAAVRSRSAQGMKRGGSVKATAGVKKTSKVSTGKRGDGIARKGKTRGTQR
ncbi:hypothetical protein UFOVP1288_61 [uncultured Caudovirales phage]|uniref:Uncharacterized protein n=1 Tax=uncultured Caudovirales phage TaxID=2100421 RepID=A0A6J5RGJ0_9CAUD|nr:hypothetical protein UFOVP1195_61 [uncultured Caudovirales phage]CAB4196119.1 hypothetical protein UFOVP1288_61 [uncultured Caudovirales phage]CAB4205147.1 hypothetical protein UFOVP1409_61 [uncultured Caudovirales phage]